MNMTRKEYMRYNRCTTKAKNTRQEQQQEQKALKRKFSSFFCTTFTTTTLKSYLQIGRGTLIIITKIVQEYKSKKE